MNIVQQCQGRRISRIADINFYIWLKYSIFNRHIGWCVNHFKCILWLLTYHIKQLVTLPLAMIGGLLLVLMPSIKYDD